MPIYQYKAKNPQGIIIEDIVYAPAKSTAVAELARQGMDVISIEVKAEDSFSGGAMIFTWISLHDLAKFSRYFAVLLKGGVNLLEALTILESESKNALLKKIIRDIQHQVEGGKTLNMALLPHKRHFPKLFIDLVRVGELSGKLYDSFMRITNYLEKTIEFRRKLRDTLTYPVFLFFFIFVLVAFVLTMLIPRFEEIYSSMGGELPMPTQILIAIGNFSRTNFWLINGGIILVITMYLQFNSTRTGKGIIDRIKLRLPVVRMLIVQYNVTNFVKSLNMLFMSGYTFLNSLKESAATVENIALMKELNMVADNIENGVSIYEAFKKSRYLPSITISMLKVGEKSNTLYEMLDNIADFNEKELDYVVSAFMRVLEPMTIIFLAFIVGSVLFAAYLPVLSMSRLIRV